MDTHQSLFSRGTDEVKGSSGSPTQLDTLFQNLTSSKPARPVEGQLNRGFQVSSEVSGIASDSSSGSGPDTRQSALLSLLGPSGSSSSRPVAAAVHQPSTAPLQVPTPPGSGHTPESDAQKFLLDQLIGGSRATYLEGGQNSNLSGLSDVNSPNFEHSQLPGHYPTQLHQSQQLPAPPHTAAPPPVLGQPLPLSNAPAQHQLSYSARENLEDPHTHQYIDAAQTPSEPSRASIFNFVSGFDVLASGTAPKKRTSDPQNEPIASSGGLGSNPAAAKSMENLMGTLLKIPTPPPPQGMSLLPSTQDIAQDHFADSDFTLPRPAPVPEINSPRSQPAPQNNLLASVASGPTTGASPRKKARGKVKPSAAFHGQTIVFDVSQPLDDIQAPREAVKSTAIALVKQDATFLPGTTIGATHWVAYAMTKGRMRVIARSSGDRTLLQLPVGIYSTTAAVTDMAVYGNRLAGVTSDGGFVVWELPNVITDDAPGQLLLCVAPPTNLSESIKFVRWHPRHADTLAVASDSRIYLLDLLEIGRSFRSQPYSHMEFKRITQVFDLSSEIVAFDFDPTHNALAMMSLDSVLTLWNIDEAQPSWSHKIRGDDPPSSLTPVDDGLVIGRKNGTVFQLFNVVSKNVHATIKFVDGAREDSDMFGHANYDPRIGALWIANSRRDSLIAFKLAIDDESNGASEPKGVYFEQACEFCGPKPTINFVLLSADQDPTGKEAEAACLAAKVPVGELALVAFSVHSTGVDQVLIRKEWFDDALMNTPAKFPPPSHHAHRVVAPADHNNNQHIAPPVVAPLPVMPPTRIRTPQFEDFDEEPRVAPEAKTSKKASGGGGSKGKNVVIKDGSEEKPKPEMRAAPVEAAVSEAAIAQLLVKEMKKTEDNLHNRFVRLLGKEMDKQHNRLGDARANDQNAEFQRQEKILHLISTELTKNTTRVVEMAVKSEVHTSVLPALENITRSEFRNVMGDHSGFAQAVSHHVASDMEQVYMRQDISNHIASIISKNLNPLIDRAVKEAMAKAFASDFAHQATMHQELLHDIRNEFSKFKNETAARQSDTQRAQEVSIRDLDHSIRLLNDKVKFMSLGPSNPPSNHAPAQTQYQQHRSNDSPTSSNVNTSHTRQHQPPTVPPQMYPPQVAQQTFQSQPVPISGNHPWYATGLAAPQASHPINIQGSAGTSSITQTPPVHQTEEWDETYLEVLSAQDPRQLQELLLRSKPDIVMPLNARSPLSQAVLLTLLHRLTNIVAEAPPADEAFKASLWWLKRTATIINVNDPQISPYIARVVPNVQTSLNTTKQRITLLPGGPQLMDAAHAITDIQETLRNKSA